MSETKEQDSLVQQAVEFLEQLLMTPANPDLPPELAVVADFDRLYALVVDIKDVLFHFSKGEFGHKFRQPGSTAGYIKALQSNIRHLAWQCNAVADGDLSQRVEFMGPLSDAFNRMTEILAAKQEMIQLKQSQLTRMTEELQNEVKKKEEMEAALRASEEMYRQRSLRDPLTGLYNRGYFFESAAREMENIKRMKHGQCCVLMMDIDFFKKFNDTHGHICGDQAIKMVASCIDRSLRKSDIFARYGGEEFSLYLANASLEKGTAIAERIRATVAAQPSPAKNSKEPVTISIGLCAVESSRLNPMVPGSKILLEALADADAALYIAKEKGRNRVWTSPLP